MNILEKLKNKVVVSSKTNKGNNTDNNSLNNKGNQYEIDEKAVNIDDLYATNNFEECVSFKDGSKIIVKHEPYLLSNSSIEERKKLLHYYRKLFLNKEIKDYKIIDVSLYEYNEKFLVMFDVLCSNCGRTQRITALNNDIICKCKQIRFADWNIAKHLNYYPDMNQFIENNNFKPNERLFVINPKKEININNIIKTTYSEFKKISEKEDVEDKTKCPNCGFGYENGKCPICRAQAYNKSDIRNEIVSKRYYEKQDVDNTWENNLIPYCVNYYLNYENNSYVDTVTELNLKYYYLENNKLNRMGSYYIKEINNDYYISDYLFYINGYGLVKYENVYKEFRTNLYNPIVQYVIDDKKYDPERKLLKTEQMDNINLIYFSKAEKNCTITLNVYHKDELIIKIENIKKVLKNMFDKSLLLEFNDDTNKYFDIDSYELFETDYDGTTEIYDFNDLNTNILFNIKNMDYDEVFKEKLSKYTKNDSKNIKLVYINEDVYLDNLILVDYLKKNSKLELVENEFSNDKTFNYVARIDRKNKEMISFIEYVLTKPKSTKNQNSFNYLIYGIPLNHITSAILSELDIKEKITSMIRNGDIIIQDKNKEEKIIRYIHMHYFTKNNEYEKIISKLLNKYQTNEIGLLIILLYKYGEELVFNLPNIENIKYNVSKYSVGIENNSNTEYNQKIYDNLLLNLDTENVKWKSELSMYKLLKNYFPDAIYQYRFKELGQQSLDVFIPTKNIAFEYQGQQHYEPVDIFGGKEHFERQQQNDENKKRICKENNIILIEWKYNENINKIVLDKKLIDYKPLLEDIYEFNE